MIKRIAFALFVLCMVLSLNAQNMGKSELQEKYRKWLEEEVVYIITPREKDVFLKLTTDRERDLFIEAFWKQRDPSPGTPRNEFKEEHYRRVEYANGFFGRGTPRPGWRTDMGRVYIVLGPPNNIEYFENVLNVYPTQVWAYFGDPKFGLPTAFNIVFFKKYGTGEYIFYSPSDHGPQSLIADYLGDARDALDGYQRLNRLEPNLAKHTLSLIPGERSVPGVVSLASNQLFSAVFSSPQKRVEDKYAEAILKYKDFVEVEYTANYIGSDAIVKTTEHEGGFSLVHYSVEPKKLSVDRVGDEYTALFELDGRVTDSSGRTVFQYTKELPLNLTESQIQDLGSTSLALQDMFPLVPGHYRFNLLVKNTTSREFTSLESDILIPQVSSQPWMSPLILGYRIEKSPREDRNIVPFRMEDNQIFCWSKRSFVKKESLHVCFQILGLSDEQKSQGSLRFVFFKEGQEVSSRTKKLNEYELDRDFIEKQSLQEFSPGYYSVRVSVLDEEGREILQGSEDFEISFAADLPKPLIVSKIMPSSHIEEYDYIRGTQFLNIGNIKEANVLLEKAYHKNPRWQNYALGYTQVLFIEQKFEKVKEVLMPFLNSPDESDGVLYFLGKAKHSLGEYPEALAIYEKYLSRFGLNLEILNLTGTCHYQLGDKKEALKVWERSLEINPNQIDIKKLVESLKQER